MLAIISLTSLLVTSTSYIGSLQSHASTEDTVTSGCLGVSVSQDEIQTKTQQLVECYFTARGSLNTTKCTEQLSGFVLPAMIEDEINRLSSIEKSDILTISNAYSITELTVSEYLVCVTVNETVNYNSGTSFDTSNVEHDLMFDYDPETSIIKLVRDCYYEEKISFKSLSYIEKRESASVYANSTATNDHKNTGDYAYDLIQVALTQEGYHEKATNDNLDSKTENNGANNWTKYGAWYAGGAYNGQAWCAMFVSWCANQAGIPESVIKPNCRANEIRQTFIDSNLFQYSSSNGNTYAPKIGDLICFDHHIGIVVSSDNEKVYIIDGNFHTNNDVRQREYSLTDTSIIGYATPDYDSGGNTHSWNSTYECNSDGHWQYCSLCGKQSDVASHTLGNYEHDGNYHWRSCTLCGMQSAKTAHIWMLYEVDARQCKYCGLIQWNHVLQNILAQLEKE